MKCNRQINLISITFLSLLDIIFDLNHLAKSSLFAGIWIFFVLLFLYTLFSLLKDFKFESSYYKYIFFIFFLFGLVTVWRGWSFKIANLTAYLRVPYTFWPFLMPLFTFFDKKLGTIIFMMECLFYMGLIFLGIALWSPHILTYRPSAEPLIFALSLGCEFLLLNSTYLNNKKTNISFIIIFLSTLSLLYLARRASASLFIGVIISSYLLSLGSKTKPLLFKIFPFLLVGGAIIFFSFDDIKRPLTTNLSKRLTEDTRSIVIDYFMQDMRNDMVFGKGMNGRYFCPVGGGGMRDDGVEWEQVDYRDTIENGYLHLILSGGIIYLVLFLLIYIPAAFNGIFRSSNRFSRSCGVIVLLWLIYMFAYGQPNLSIGYMLVWIAIGFCYKPSIRNKTDNEILLELKSLNRIG